MAGMQRIRRQNMTRKFLQIFVTVNSLNLIIHAFANLDSQNQVFIQNDNDLRYVVSDIDIKSYQDTDIDFQSPVKLVPPMLDFGERPVGMPHQMQVTLVNNDDIKSLHLSYISGNTPHFHCSFFESKTVTAGANTTFDVVFLARQVGNVENTLYIHSKNGGVFKYNVFGVGTPNPYRVRPLVGARLPINSSFSPIIHMHNPHSWPLQVTEMYSSGGDLHLELPTGQLDAPKNFWHIEPFQTKPVMRANFLARTAEKHTSFIRIKTSHRSSNSNRRIIGEELVLPVEVEVSSKHGIYSPIELLDFGLMRSSDSIRSLKLSLLATHKPVYITNVELQLPNNAVTIDFRPITINAGIHNGPTHIATIHYDVSKALNDRQFYGKIIVRTKYNSLSVIIPYQANVMRGCLDWNLSETLFYMDSDNSILINSTKWLSLMNNFNNWLVIFNATLSDYTHFSISNFTKPILLEPKKNLTKVIKIFFNPKLTNLKHCTNLILHTNASTFNIPIYAYNGWLKVVHHRPEIFKGQLDFGTLGISESRIMSFTLRNDNPVDIFIKQFRSNFNQTVVTFLGMEKGNGTLLSTSRESNNRNINEKSNSIHKINGESDSVSKDILNKDLIRNSNNKIQLILPAYHFAVFNVNLTAPSYEGTFATEVIIITDFQNLYIPITLRTAEGSLSTIPEKIVLDNNFPTKIVSHVLKIQSTFHKYMQIKNVRFEPNDTRFYYEPPTNGNKHVILNSGSITNAGTIRFDASKSCQVMSKCYLGLSTNHEAGKKWLNGSTLEKNVSEIDQYLYSRFHNFWNEIKLTNNDNVNVTIELNTNEIRGFLYPAFAQMTWPSLTNRKVITFPLTQLGNTSSAHIDLYNPSDLPILFQVLPLSVYPSPYTLLNLLSDEHLNTNNNQSLINFLDPNAYQFSLLDLNFPHNETASDLRSHIEKILGVKSDKRTFSALIAGNSKRRIRLGFTPDDDTEKASLIIIRNNLTILDSVVVQGQGATGHLKLSGMKSTENLKHFLTYDYNERQLRYCDRRKSSSSSNMNINNAKNIMANFVLRRSIIATNTGLLPIYINSITIDGEHCSSSGFSVIDCYPNGFSIAPNTTKKLEILFTPDFTMSRLDKTLKIFSSIQPNISYDVHMHVSIPAHLLWKCAMSLPRPNWERMLYYLAIAIVAFMLACILLSSYFEADRLLTVDVQNRMRESSNARQALDLNSFSLKSISNDNSEPALLNNISSLASNSSVSEILDDGNVSKSATQTSSSFRHRKQQQSIFTKLFSVMLILKRSIIDAYKYTRNHNDEYQHRSKNSNTREAKNNKNFESNRKKDCCDTVPITNTSTHNSVTPVITNKVFSSQQKIKPSTTLSSITSQQNGTSSNIPNLNNNSKKSKRLRKNSKTPSIRQNCLDFDKDDTSSTTTETSSTDPEFHVRVPTPELILRNFDLDHQKVDKKVKSKSSSSSLNKETKKSLVCVPPITTTNSIVNSIPILASAIITTATTNEKRLKYDVNLDSSNDNEFIATKPRQRRKESRNKIDEKVNSVNNSNVQKREKTILNGNSTVQNRERSKKSKSNRNSTGRITTNRNVSSSPIGEPNGPWSITNDRPKDAFTDTTLFDPGLLCAQFVPPGDTANLNEIKPLIDDWDTLNINNRSSTKSNPPELNATYSQVVLNNGNNCSYVPQQSHQRNSFDNSRNNINGSVSNNISSQWGTQSNEINKFDNLGRGIIEDDNRIFDYRLEQTRNEITSNISRNVLKNETIEQNINGFNQTINWSDRNISWNNEQNQHQQQNQQCKQYSCENNQSAWSMWNPMPDETNLQNIWKNNAVTPVSQSQPITQNNDEPAQYDIFNSLGSIWNPASANQQQQQENPMINSWNP